MLSVKFRVGGIVAALSVGGLVAPAGTAAAATFTEVAREFVNGVGSLNADVPVALSDDGRVAFSAKSIPANVDGLFAWKSGTLTPINLVPGGYTQLTSVAVNSAGNLAFVARREAGAIDQFGVYRTTTSAGAIATLREEPFSPGAVPKPRYVALSENGTVAYSTIVDGAGAIYRGPVTGAQSVLRSGTGMFYNTQRLDVNNAGQVAVQMEHTKPTGGGLGRGILVFETPQLPVPGNKTAIEQLDVGIQPQPTINSAGQVAFSLNTTETLTFYNPPNNASGAVLGTVTLQPGVYVTTATGYGLPRTFTQIANTAGAYKNFGERVLINDKGTVVFTAGLDAGGGGIFTGGNPVTDEVISQADMLGNTFVSFLSLGELNNADQFTFITSDFKSTDRQVWIAQVPEPGPGLLAAAMLLASMAVRSKRR